VPFSDFVQNFRQDTFYQIETRRRAEKLPSLSVRQISVLVHKFKHEQAVGAQNVD
jgi:hypothetical protein